MAAAFHRICETLKEAGFSQRKGPLKVGTLRLDFPTMFEGPMSGSELILLIDLTETWLAKVERQLRAFLLALERIDSKRVVSVVLLYAQDMSSETIDHLARLCRVLLVSEKEENITACLRVLLPLHLPRPSRGSDSIESELRDAVAGVHEAQVHSALLDAAKEGAGAVEMVFLKWLDEEITSAGISSENQAKGDEQ